MHTVNSIREMTEIFQRLFTERVNLLFKEAESLKLGFKYQFQTMDDPDLLKRSMGAAITESDEGEQETIHLDPERADEHALAHELMHSILHRSRWPQMYSMILGD